MSPAAILDQVSTDRTFQQPSWSSTRTRLGKRQLSAALAACLYAAGTFLGKEKASLTPGTAVPLHLIN